MEIIETDFKDLLIIKSNIFVDNRGLFKEIFRADVLSNFLGRDIKFIQSNLSFSKKNVFRGLHFQKKPYEQAKLVSVMSGKILDIVVDMRKKSKTFGKTFSIKIDSKDNLSLFIPRGFAHGYLTLSDSAIINYTVDNYYNPDAECGIPYDDDFLNIEWGISKDKLIISDKDKNHKPYKW